MDFSDALKALKEGKKVRRKSISSDEYLEIDYPIPNDPIIYVKRSGSSVMFTPTQGHLFAKDWEIFEPKKVLVKIKTVEYITCSNCGKYIEVMPGQPRETCMECGTEMVLGRESEYTVEEAKCILDLANFFNIMYFPML